MSSSGTVIPRTPLTCFTLTVSFRGSMEFPVLTSKVVLLTLPQLSSSMRWRARFIAITVVYSSTPLENLKDESETWPKALELLRMLSCANFAASNITAFVVSRISELRPPMMPASATGFLPSQITRLSFVRENSFSSKVTIFSPSSARRT